MREVRTSQKRPSPPVTRQRNEIHAHRLLGAGWGAGLSTTPIGVSRTAVVSGRAVEGRSAARYG
jgi:hypothetical protein